jgi:hypothetical protein
VKLCDKAVTIEGRFPRIGRLAADGYEFLDDPPAALAKLRTTRTGIDLFTFLQRLPDTSPRYDYPVEWDNVAALSVSTFDHWWGRQIGAKVRNQARLAGKRGVTVREAPFDDAFVQGISAIYNESPIRQGRRFPHFEKPIELVRKENATFPDRTVYIGAYLGDTMIGFAKLVSDETGIQAGLMQILSMIQHRDKAPTNALIAQAVRSCAERHIPYLVYSQFSYGKKERDSLSHFKEANGFQKIDLPRYYVPLTLAGRWALRWGLHHGLAERLPESVLARLRRLRTVWHARRVPVAGPALESAER